MKYRFQHLTPETLNLPLLLQGHCGGLCMVCSTGKCQLMGADIRPIFHPPTFDTWHRAQKLPMYDQWSPYLFFALIWFSANWVCQLCIVLTASTRTENSIKGLNWKVLMIVGTHWILPFSSPNAAWINVVQIPNFQPCSRVLTYTDF